MPLSGERLRQYFRQLFDGQHDVTPQEGDRLTVTTEAGDQSVRVQDVTNIGIHEHSDGRRTERFSIILEGDLEVVLHDDCYDFGSGLQQYPMDVRHFGPDAGGSRIYEAVLEVDEPTSF